MKRTPIDDAAPSACANCGQAFGAPPPNFCPACGQESRISAPSVGEFLQQFGGAYFSTEGALWRTLKLLLLKPGELTVQYLQGRRKHYVLPLRLYLSISLAVLLLVRLFHAGFGSLDEPGVREGILQGRNNLGVSIGFGSAQIGPGGFKCVRLPDVLCDRLQQRISAKPENFIARLHQAQQRIYSQASAAMFVMVPLFALLLWAFFAGRGLKYTEHLVMALHVHAVIFIALGLGLLPWEPWQGACILAAVLHVLLSLRHVYRLGWGSLAWRSAALLALYAAAVVAILTGLGVWALIAD